MSPRHPISGCPEELIGFSPSSLTVRWPTPSRFVTFDPQRFGARVLAQMGPRSFRDVAKDVGVSSATLNRVARGKSPDVQTYLRISAWLSKDQPA